MWAVAGVLLGAFALLVLLGMRAGPHSHLLGVLVGALAACWLLAMAALGQGRALLWMLFGIDLAATAAVGFAARAALRHPAVRNHLPSLDGREGIAVSDLDPDGIVRVGGEEWSAHSLNGAIGRGERIQVVEGRGVRIGVWGLGALPSSEHNDPPAGERRAGTPW